MRFHPGLVFLLLSSVAHYSYGQMPARDTVEGVKDHPLMSRFDGAKLVGYDLKAFDEAVLPAGKAIRNKEGKLIFENIIRTEGRYTRIAYNFPKERSSLEVMRNYQEGLARAGLTTIFSCAKESCGAEFGELVWKKLENNFVQGSYTTDPFIYGRSEPRYVVSKGTLRDGTPVHAFVYVIPPVQQKNGGVYVEIVEQKPMEAGKVSTNLDAGDMAKGIRAEGKVAVYGVYFDTAKADIKPESKPSLSEMAKLLQQDAALKVYVVGHTDNRGALQNNTELSQKRAEAVARALTNEYKIDAKRLVARGVASLAPMASNDNDAGRDKNRRVELVKQ